MVGWLEIVIIAFGAQLAVLPGEKVQFIIAGLSTRYNPLVVVAAAGSAFAGWTALEILFGNAIQGALPGTYLDLIAAAMFLLFAVLLIRSAPGGQQAETDGGMFSLENGEVEVTILGREVPDALGGFLPIFLMMAAGEFGDKTQLITITLAIQYGAHPGIWVGEMLAIIPVSLANAFFFHRFAGRFDVRRAHFAAGGLFAFFGFDTLLQLAINVSVWETIVTGLADLLLALGP